MNSNRNNAAFDSAMRIISGLSILSSIFVLVAARLPREGGPEPTGREVMLMFTLLAQLALFVVCVAIGVIITGFRGGLRLTQASIGMILAAICGLVLEYIVMQ